MTKKKTKDDGKSSSRIKKHMTHQIDQLKNKVNGSTKLSSMFETTKKIKVVGHEEKPEPAAQASPNHVINDTTSNTEQSELDSHVSFATKASMKGAATFDIDRFTNTHNISNKATPNPDKQVLKLLKKLLKIYMSYFDPKIFCESKLAVRDEQKQNLPMMVDEMKMLRNEEHEKLGSREICFD